MVADALVFLAGIPYEPFAAGGIFCEEGTGHPYAAGSIEHMHDGEGVMGFDFDGRVGFGGGRSSDEEGDLELLAFHFLCDMDHFIEGGGDQSAEADHIHLFVPGCFQDFIGGHHDAEVHDVVAVAAEHDADDIFSDIVYIAFDGGHEYFAFGTAAAGCFFRFDEGG